MDFMFGVFPIFFMATFLLVFGTIIFSITKSAKQWHKNNNSPRLTVDATIVGKRQNVSYHRHNGANNMTTHTTSSTRYYVTFQVESGDRMELEVDGMEYGMLIEGDYGDLTFQGTRYLSFIRK